MFEKTVYVWRDVIKSGWGANPGATTHCPYCQSSLLADTWVEGAEDWPIDCFNGRCPLCGWHAASRDQEFYFSGAEHVHVGEQSSEETILRSFNINSLQLGLAELGSHLKKQFGDIYSLSWRRFEQLVDDLSRRSYGFRTHLTQPTRDGGADIIVLENETSKEFALIECKKYSASRTIGVSAVRQLVGAAVDWDVRRAWLVTTSDFSTVARQKVNDYAYRGFDIDLVAASDLLKMLAVYNKNLPPLEYLSEEVRREIIRENSRGSERLLLSKP